MYLSMDEPFRRRANQRVRYNAVHDHWRSDALSWADGELRLTAVFVSVSRAALNGGEMQRIQTTSCRWGPK